jgi:oxaloacetate decarboxylase gamma subunit
MTIVEMLGQSGVLTLLGMGIVFGFLVIMIISITVVGRIIQALGSVAAAPVTGAAGNGAEVTAAITAAVNEYRKKG